MRKIVNNIDNKKNYWLGNEFFNITIRNCCFTRCFRTLTNGRVFHFRTINSSINYSWLLKFCIRFCTFIINLTFFIVRQCSKHWISFKWFKNFNRSLQNNQTKLHAFRCRTTDITSTTCIYECVLLYKTQYWLLMSCSDTQNKVTLQAGVF